MSGWNTFTPKKRKLGKYDTREVVILNKGKNPIMYFSDPVVKRLGKPAVVVFHTRGSNVAISAQLKDQYGYKVQYPETGLAHVACKGFLAEHPFDPGVYDVHIEQSAAGSMVVFDTQSKAAKI